jgi:hypothetical protein
VSEINKPVKKTAKKVAPKKAVKAAAQKPSPPAQNGADPNRLGKPFRAVLECLMKGPKTRSQISEATGIHSGFTSLLGHMDPDRREPQSLTARKFIKPEQHDIDGKDVVLYSITATGKKAMERARKEDK